MTDREKKLGLAVLCLVPFFIVFYFVMNFTTTYGENRKSIVRVEEQILKEMDLQTSAMGAVRRREYYDRRSLPTNLNDSRIQYEKYLNFLTKDCGLEIRTLSSKRGGKSEISYNGDNGRTKVMDQVTFTLSGKGELEQITEFLHKFYSLDFLHRISQFNLDPITLGGGGAKQFEREGNYKINMTIDVASMVSGDDSREFKDQVVELKKSLDDYNLAILNRNMFGPANNAPKLITGQKKTVTENSSDISYQLSASDSDKNDKLTFKLISSEIADAKLEQKSAGATRATFSAPSQKPGRYKYRVQVTDSGYPNKSIEEECVLVVEKKRIVRDTTPKEEPEPDPVMFAPATSISAVFMQGGTYKAEIWIRPTDERNTYTVGNTFLLDDKEWTFKDMAVRTVVIECDGELLTYDLKGGNSILDKPASRKKITTSAETNTASEAPAVEGN